MDINKTILIGRLTKDPEMSYTKSNKAICKFSIASNGKTKDEVSFFEIVTWQKTAENCNTYLSKGKQVCVEGRLKQDRWKDKNGYNKSRIVINAEIVQFTSNGKSNDKPKEQPSNDNFQNYDDDTVENSPLIDDDEIPFD